MKNDKNKTYHERYNSFYQSAEWKALRESRFAFAEGLCEMCRKKGIVRAGREVHHIVEISQDWSKRLDFDNTILLCSDCHNEQHERISPLQKFLREWENI